VATPFNFYDTNDFLNMSEVLGIQGLIIIFDSSIDAAGVYEEPKIISQATYEEGELIRAYSYPIYNGA
jgi:hypothetical protein